MALQSTGQISLADIATEFSDSPPHALSEFYSSHAGAPSSGQISIGANFYGASACYAAGTAVTLYSHSSGLGVGGVGEGFYRTLEEYTAPKCGTYNLSGTASAGVQYFTKQITITLAVNTVNFHTIYSVGGGSGQTWTGSYNHNMANSVVAGDKIQLRGYLWGGFGSDRFDSSSMVVKVA